MACLDIEQFAAIKIQCQNCHQFYPKCDFVGKKFKGKQLVKKCIKCRIVDKHGTIKRSENKLEIIQEFLSQGCSMGLCPPNTKAAECDHLPKKHKKFKLADYKLYSINEIKVELQKCQPLCRFCHSVKTKKEAQADEFMLSQTKQNIDNRQLVERNKKYVLAKKFEIGNCAICKLNVREEWIQAFHFDHVGNGAKEKINDISTLQSKTYSIDVIQTEINKCRLLCADCHFDETQKQLNLLLV